MPRVDLAFPHLFTVFPPQIRPRFTVFATDPTNPVQNLPDDRRLPDVRHLSRHRTSAKHRTTGTPTTESFTGFPVSTGRPTQPERPDDRYLPDVRQTLKLLILFSSTCRYHPPSANTIHISQPPSISRSEFEKSFSLCLGYLSCGFTISLDVLATLEWNDIDNTTAHPRQGR